jgi:hypothetical protein
VILALFTASGVSATVLPETAYGHIALTEREAPTHLAAATPKETVGASSKLAVNNSHPDATESIVRSYFHDIPVMIEVARCESTFRHTLADGTILRGRVDSADTGVMQINKRYHLQSATAMDLNLDDIYDNMAYARHLYETQGIQPWSASAPCWNRTLAANI